MMRSRPWKKHAGLVEGAQLSDARAALSEIYTVTKELSERIRTSQSALKCRSILHGSRQEHA